MAGPNAPSAAPPPSVRSTWRADHCSTEPSIWNASRHRPPQSTAIRQGSRVRPASGPAASTGARAPRASAATSAATAANTATGPSPASRARPVASADAA